MANHLHGILAQWYTQRDEFRWVLGTVIQIEGSNYRKAGAMILVNQLGQYFGLISTRCLEKFSHHYSCNQSDDTQNRNGCARSQGLTTFHCTLFWLF